MNFWLSLVLFVVLAFFANAGSGLARQPLTESSAPSSSGVPGQKS